MEVASWLLILIPLYLHSRFALDISEFLWNGIRITLVAPTNKRQSSLFKVPAHNHRQPQSNANLCALLVFQPPNAPCKSCSFIPNALPSPPLLVNPYFCLLCSKDFLYFFFRLRKPYSLPTYNRPPPTSSTLSLHPELTLDDREV